MLTGIIVDHIVLSYAYFMLCLALYIKLFNLASSTQYDISLCVHMSIFIFLYCINIS